MTIIVSKEGKTSRIDKSNFDNEDRIQEFIHENPESLPFYSSEDETNLLTIAREFPTSHGSIDVLGINENGDIYMIEAKLHKNDTRREVIAQVIDYGAAFWSDYKNFDAFEKIMREKNGKSFYDYVKDSDIFAGIEDQDIERIKENVTRNLSNGNFKFVIVMDDLDSKLKRAIIFLNNKSSFSIYAISFAYYRTEGLEIIIPTLFGQEAEEGSTIKQSSVRMHWDKDSFFMDVQNKIPKYLDHIKKLYDFSEKELKIKMGTGSISGSFNAVFNKISPKSIFSVYSDGKLTINIDWLDHTKDEERFRDAYKVKLSSIPGLEITFDGNHRVIIPIERWSGKVDDFINAVKDLIK